MTIGKIRSSDFQKDAQNSFSALKKFKKELEKEKFEISLSMGMSQDFEIAIKEGQILKELALLYLILNKFYMVFLFYSEEIAFYVLTFKTCLRSMLTTSLLKTP